MVAIPNMERVLMVASVFLRFDDFSESSNVDFEKVLFAHCVELRLPLCVAAIPYVGDPSIAKENCVRLRPLTPRRAQTLSVLAQAGLLEVAMHGYCHLALAPLRGLMEFGLSMDLPTQMELLRRGALQIEEATGYAPTTFVPPWNKYTPTMPEAIKAVRFSVLSGDADREPPYATSLTNPNSNSEVRYIPTTTAPARFSESLDVLYRVSPDSAVSLMIHDYDCWPSMSDDLRRLAGFRDAGRVQVRLFRECQDDPAWNLSRLIANYRIRSHRSRHFLPPGVLGVYWPEKIARRLTPPIGVVRSWLRLW